jgi:hypothetical protein
MTMQTVDETSQTKPIPEWVSAREGSRISGKSLHRLLGAAEIDLIRVRALPGRPVQYHRDDAIRWGAED